MSKMKNSGLNWIGNIPDEWNISTMKYDCTKITDYTASGSFASLAENVEYLDSPDYAMLVRVADLSNRRDIPPIYINEHSYNFLRNSNLKGGELILSNIGSVGDVFFYEPLYKKSSLAPNAILAISKYLTKYLYYYFLCPTVSNELKEIGGNAVQSKFNKTQLRAFKCLQPKRQEQKLIADFLNEKIDIIDGIICDLNNQIEILCKYKKQLISEAVTKGLNKKVSIKDSGIEWIGSIPEHWDIKLIKNICSLKGRIGWEGLTKDEYISEGPILITGINFDNGSIDWNSCEHVSEWRYNQAKSIQIKNKDLLITKDGTVGKVAIVKDCPEKVTLNSGVLLLRPLNNEYIEKYLYYVLLSNEFWHWFEIENIGNTTIIHLYQNRFAKFKLALPPIDEQKEIVNYLDIKCSEIEEILNSKIKQKEQMEQYKKSVIYEYVTGKKRVEGAEELYG